MPRGSKRVCLDNVGAGGNVFVMHFADEIRVGEIEFVVTAVDIDAFVVEPRPDRAVKDIDGF